ncbi:hypothetical protein C2E25_07595 [Geothermobacter hydrogeniphilus]|uniref:DUF4276 family protein n=1 Tax=Geothermobacter hydrogeniphilus TaxID=1969733 RepID=A0A2K2HAS5_9BACT|nr:DUF4276 family protein [Geothermobacter hydrogeniphilus]PNU20418.1 hypothetical protein C2E25_07595 [Geothermobacter hydrogeniphilus]
MITLVFLLEEPSAQDALEGILPRILPPEVHTEYLVFEGKQDLEKRMTRKLRAWLRPNSLFVVLRDQDSGDCKVIKAGLIERCRDAEREALVRIACRELEAWFVGELEAVGEAFDQPNIGKQAQKAKFRTPDNLGSPVKELRRFIPTYQKRDGARKIGHYLDPSRNRSRSFQVFVEGVQRLVQGAVK